MNYNQQYHEANKTEINLRHRKYYEEHKQEISEKKKAFYQANALRLKLKRMRRITNANQL